jgi:hypothetical protein
MHVVTETAVHAGHLDAVRELIDGRQWLSCRSSETRHVELSDRVMHRSS